MGMHANGWKILFKTMHFIRYKQVLYYYVYAMNFMHSPIHEIIIAPVYTKQTNSWNNISKAVKFFEFDIELYRVVGCEVGCEVGCASTFHALGLNS